MKPDCTLVWPLPWPITLGQALAATGDPQVTCHTGDDGDLHLPRCDAATGPATVDHVDTVAALVGACCADTAWHDLPWAATVDTKPLYHAVATHESADDLNDQLDGKGTEWLTVTDHVGEILHLAEMTPPTWSQLPDMITDAADARVEKALDRWRPAATRNLHLDIVANRATHEQMATLASDVFAGQVAYPDGETVLQAAERACEKTGGRQPADVAEFADKLWQHVRGRGSHDRSWRLDAQRLAESMPAVHIAFVCWAWPHGRKLNATFDRRGHQNVSWGPTQSTARHLLVVGPHAGSVRQLTSRPFHLVSSAAARWLSENATVRSHGPAPHWYRRLPDPARAEIDSVALRLTDPRDLRADPPGTAAARHARDTQPLRDAFEAAAATLDLSTARPARRQQTRPARG